MKTKPPALMLIFGLLLALLITPSLTNAADSITLYGREGCGLCKAMRKNLDNAGIAYTFYDVDTDKTKNAEMWKKVRRVNPDSKSIRFPVMDVNGTILVSPSFQEVKQSLTVAKAVNSITLYGREGCGLCKAMRKNLDNAGIVYTFYDVDADESKNTEMWQKIQSSDPGIKNVQFPVVDINGLILMSPSFEEVMRYL